MKVHKLKCWSAPFRAMELGLKRFELRKNDRNYQVGDVLELTELDPETGHHYEECAPVRVVVTYMLGGGEFGLPEDMVAMSVAPLPKERP
jgi:hypothetical protein